MNNLKFADLDGWGMMEDDEFDDDFDVFDDDAGDRCVISWCVTYVDRETVPSNNYHVGTYIVSLFVVFEFTWEKSDFFVCKRLSMRGLEPE